MINKIDNIQHTYMYIIVYIMRMNIHMIIEVPKLERPKLYELCPTNRGAAK